MFAKPTYYLTALNLDMNFDAVTTADVKKAYTARASNGEHPDHGGDGERWALITAAYNAMRDICSKKRGRYENKSDQCWNRAWLALNEPAAAETPKTEAPKTRKNARTDGWVFEEREGESKEDRRKRYARERQAFRYANDPKFAESRKRQSRDSHQRHVKATKG